MDLPIDTNEINPNYSSDVGPCCACGQANQTVRNVVALNKKAPVPGTGWGCFRCGLPMDGAQAVLCDDCINANAEPQEVAYGYLGDKKRISIEALSEPFKHNMVKHPEVLQDLVWFEDSPDFGQPDCICSVCGDSISEPDNNQQTVIRIFDDNREARFCSDCVPLILVYSGLIEQLT